MLVDEQVPRQENLFGDNRMAASQQSGFSIEYIFMVASRFMGAWGSPRNKKDWREQDIPKRFDRINHWETSSKSVRCKRLKKPSSRPNAFQDEQGNWWSMGEICMASAVRIWFMDETFRLMVVGYEQKGHSKITIVVFEFILTPEVMNVLYGGVPLGRIAKWDCALRAFNQGGTVEARKAKEVSHTCLDAIEKDYPHCLIGLRPKIDSKKQRRLQCAISIQTLLRVAQGRILSPSELIEYGFVSWPMVIPSPPRARKKGPSSTNGPSMATMEVPHVPEELLWTVQQQASMTVG